MRKNKKAALMMAVMGLGVYAPAMGDGVIPILGANKAEAASNISGIGIPRNQDYTMQTDGELTFYYSNGGYGTFNVYINGVRLVGSTGDGSYGGDQHSYSASVQKGDTIRITGDQGYSTYLRNFSKRTVETLDVEKEAHFKGPTTFENDVTVKGNERIDGTLDVGGDAHFHGNAEIDKNLHVHGDAEVDGDSRIHGNQVIDKDQTVYGNSDLQGDLKVHGNSRLLDDVQIGDDKNKDNFDVWAKTNLHGDTIVGDDANDKFTVNATSEFKADAVFDKNVHIKGNLETDGDAETHGNQIIDGDLTVKGNTNLGDDKTKDAVDIVAKANLHGDTTIGDNADDRLVINATSEFKADADFDKDVHIKGNAEVDKNMTVHGDTILDGKFFATGAAQFGDDLDIAKNLTVGGNTFVKQNLGVEGNAYVDGDIYGRSFNVGNERYIDANGINANNHKIRNVADGEISPNSLDAVNGRQLYHAREALQYNVNQVGAGAAAMANLHPLEFEHNDKLTVSAAIGNYKDKTALATGVFYRPTPKTMVNLSGTLGYGENMMGIGFSAKMGKTSEESFMTEEQLRDKVAEIHDENDSLKKQVEETNAMNKQLEEKNVAFENQLSALTTKNASLENRLDEMTKAYKELLSKVDTLIANK